jgi:hypothetical protein
MTTMTILEVSAARHRRRRAAAHYLSAPCDRVVFQLALPRVQSISKANHKQKKKLNTLIKSEWILHIDQLNKTTLLK